MGRSGTMRTGTNTIKGWFWSSSHLQTTVEMISHDTTSLLTSHFNIFTSRLLTVVSVLIVMVSQKVGRWWTGIGTGRSAISSQIEAESSTMVCSMHIHGRTRQTGSQLFPVIDNVGKPIVRVEDGAVRRPQCGDSYRKVIRLQGNKQKKNTIASLVTDFFLFKTNEEK